MREENQDSWVMVQAGSGWLLAVCDGMGGVQGGARASELAANTLRERADTLDVERPTEPLTQAIQDANTRILNEARQDLSRAGMGTTMVCAFVRGRQVHISWAGDSRAALRQPDGTLRWLTTDHTRVQELVDMGLIPPEQAEGHPYGHILSRAVGVSATLQVDSLEPFELGPDERLLLCSDGVSGAASATELAEALGAPSAEQAIDAVNLRVAQNEGDDNATAVLWIPDLPPAEFERPRPQPSAEHTEPASKGPRWDLVVAGALGLTALGALIWQWL